jgi:hypothetical protein
MRLDPRHSAQTALWYAKLLKQLGLLGPAELLYRVALDKTAQSGSFHLEATALCNYATFLYKYRHNHDKALSLYTTAIKK